jgi:CBS domain-containing protein
LKGDGRVKAKEMMQIRIISVSSETSLAEARRVMTANKIRHLPVVSNGRLVGIVTDRDIRNASPSPATTLSRGEINYQLDTTPIKTCMTKDILTVGPDEDLVQGGQRIISGQLGCLPVLDEGQLVGIITETDLLKGFLAAASPAGELMKVKDYMQKSPYTLGRDDLVLTAYHLMHDKHIRHLPIIASDAKLIGIVTDRDIRQAGASTAPHMAEHELTYLIQKMTIKDIMTTHLHTVQGETVVADAGQRLLEHKIGCLPVVNPDGGLEGILTVTDLLKAFIEQH